MRFVAGLGAVAESHRESAASRGAVVAKLLRPGDATERDAAGRGTVVDLLARAPRRCCWPRVPWRRGWRHRGRSGSIGKHLQEWKCAQKKPARVSGCETLAGVR